MHLKKPVKPSSFNVMEFFRQHAKDSSPSTYQKNQNVYSQGKPADCVFYIHTGKVKVTVVSKRGKEVIAATAAWALRKLAEEQAGSRFEDLNVAFGPMLLKKLTGSLAICNAP